VFAAFPLEGSRVRLEPLTLKHVPGLLATATSDRASFAFESVPSDEAAMSSYAKTALGSPDQYPFTIIDASSGAVAGCVRFMSIERWDGVFRDGLFPHALEVGGLWHASSLAPRALLEIYSLMFTEVFDEWSAQRVSVRVDAEDADRKAVVEKTGAVLDGVLRGQQLAFGRSGPRSIACYSMLKSEWSVAKKALAKKL
jgi:N-acetyltransferase